MKQLRQIAAIAGNTARELVRNPAYVILVGFGVAATVFAPAFAFFHLGEQLKMVADLGLGTALVIGLLVGVLGASWAVNEELESLSALAVLAKPLSRTTFLLGKYIGVLAAAALAVVVLGFALLLTLRGLAADSVLFLVCGGAALLMAVAGAALFVKLGAGTGRAAVTALGIVAAALIVVLGRHGVLIAFGREVSGWEWRLLPALLGGLLQVAVLAALAVALATRLGLAANLPVVLSVFVLGQLTGDAQSLDDSQAQELARFLGGRPGVSVEGPDRGASFFVRLDKGQLEAGRPATRAELTKFLDEARGKGVVDLRVRVSPAAPGAAGERDGARFEVTVSPPLRALLGWVVPDLVAFQFSDAVAEHISAGGAATGSPVSASVLLGATLVAAAYVAGALVLGTALIRRRDLQ